MLASMQSIEDKIMSASQATKLYGHKIAILGGVDVHFLRVAREMQIRDYVDEVISSCAPGGGYALGTGASGANYIPVKNYLIMLDEGRRVGNYSIPAS